MLSDLHIAQICNQLYFPSPQGFWSAEFPHDGGYAALRREPGYDVAVWRGSVTPIDWLDDFDSLPVLDPVLGWVHQGFRAGVEAVQAQLDKAVTQPLIITGHSLGAAHAWLHAGLRITSGQQVSRVVVMGSPRPGFAKLAELLSRVPSSSYKNRLDPVTGVPLTTLLFPYQEPAPFIELNSAPPSPDSWGVLADHHVALYLDGISKLGERS